MNTFLQSSASRLLGAEEKILELAAKERSRLLVVSDSHGNYGSFKEIVREFGRQCDALIFCGDGIEDLARLSAECVEDGDLAEYVPPVIGVVEGNNDPDTYLIRGALVEVPLSCAIEASGHQIFFTHGHRYSLYNGTEAMRKIALSAGCTAVFFGHTHVAFSALESGNIFTMNPGSCSRPRNGQPPSFAIVDVEKEKRNFDCVFYQFISGNSTPYVPGDSMF